MTFSVCKQSAWNEEENGRELALTSSSACVRAGWWRDPWRAHSSAQVSGSRSWTKLQHHQVAESPSGTEQEAATPPGAGNASPEQAAAQPLLCRQGWQGPKASSDKAGQWKATRTHGCPSKVSNNRGFCSILQLWGENHTGLHYGQMPSTRCMHSDRQGIGIMRAATVSPKADPTCSPNVSA